MMNASFVESLHYSRVLATLLDYCLRFSWPIRVSSAATALWLVELNVKCQNPRGAYTHTSLDEGSRQLSRIDST